MDSPRPAPAPPSRTPVYFGFAVVERADGRSRLRWRWGRLAALLGGLAVGGYLTAAGALWAVMHFVQRDEQATYADALTFPWAQDEYRRRRAQRDIAGAYAAVEAGQYQRAYLLARTGLARSPKNLKGIRLLASFYLAGGQRQLPDALDLLANAYPEALRLEEGPADSPANAEKLEFLTGYLRLLLSLQRDDELVAFADEHLPPPAPGLAQHFRLLAQAAAEAHYFRGRLDRAERLLDDYALRNEAAAVMLQARIDWDRGRHEVALRTLEGLGRQFPRNADVMYFLHRFYQLGGHFQRALRYAVQRASLQEDDPRPRLEIIAALDRLQEPARAEAEAARLLRDFAADEPALRLLANHAADAGKVRLARLCYEEVLRRDHEPGTFALLFIEANLVAGDFARALADSDRLAEENPPWLAQSEEQFNALRVLANFGAGRPEAARLLLERYAQGNRAYAPRLLALGRRLDTVGHPEAALDLFTRAHQLEPHNRTALLLLINARLRAAEPAGLAEHLDSLLAMRRPPSELFERAQALLEGDRFLFNRDEQALALVRQALAGDRLWRGGDEFSGLDYN